MKNLCHYLKGCMLASLLLVLGAVQAQNVSYWNTTYFTPCLAATNSVTPQIGSMPGLSPADGVLPCITAGVAVSDTIYFKNFTTFSGLIVNSWKFDSIYLPAGLCWSTNKANNSFAGGEDGIILIQGTTNAPDGQYKLRIVVDANAGPGGIVNLINQDAEALAHMRYHLRIKSGSATCMRFNSVDTISPFTTDTGAYVSPLSVSISPSGNTTFCIGDSVRLTANPYSGSGGYAYQWSTGATTQSIEVYTANVFTVTVYNGSQNAIASLSTYISPNCNPSTTPGTGYLDTAYFSACQNATNLITPNIATVPGIQPADSALPCMVRGTFVSDTLYFKNFTTLAGININYLKFDSIYLPAGLCWSTNKATNQFTGGEDGVILIQGTTYAPEGQYKLRMVVDLNAGSGGIINLVYQDWEQLAHVRYRVRVRSAANTCMNFNSLDTVSIFTTDSGAYVPHVTVGISASGSTNLCPGNSVTLTAYSNTGTIFRWSTGVTAQSIQVSAAGSYTVTAHAGADSAVAYPVNVTINTNCGGSGTGYWDPNNFSQCNGATNVITPVIGSVPGLNPSDSSLPCAVQGMQIYDTIYFTNFATFSSLNVNYLKFDSIYLPAGLCWSTNKANNQFIGGETGVILISGTTTAPAGQYKLRIIVDADAGPGGIVHLTNQDAEQLAHLRYSLRIVCTGNSCLALNTTDTTSIIIPDNRCSTFPAGVTSSGSTTLCGNDSVTLTATSGAGYTYLWSTAETTQSIRVGGISATYTVTIQSGSNSVSVSVPITVHQPYAHFSIVPDPNAAHVWLVVNQCSTAANTSYSWTWGDGSPADAGATPSHTYATAGYYNICVAVNESGCTADYCDSSTYEFKADQAIQMQVVQYATGINDLTQNNLTVKYFGGSAHFAPEVSAASELRLYDMSGRMIQQQTNWTGSTWPIDDRIAGGVYTISLQNKSQKLSQKIAITR